MDETKSPGIKIAQFFLGKVVFEHDPNMLNQPVGSNPGDHELQVTVTSGISEDKRNGIASVVIQTTAESKGSYRFLVEMVGLFEQEHGAENMDLSDYLTSYAPPAMYPFVREAVANITGRGRFGPVWLKPINFATAEAVETIESSE